MVIYRLVLWSILYIPNHKAAWCYSTDTELLLSPHQGNRKENCSPGIGEELENSWNLIHTTYINELMNICRVLMQMTLLRCRWFLEIKRQFERKARLHLDCFVVEVSKTS